MIVLLTLALLLTGLGVCCKNAPFLEERKELDPGTQLPSPELPFISGQLTNAEIQLVAEVVKSVLRAVMRSKGQSSPGMTYDLQSTAEQVLHHLDLSSPSDKETLDAHEVFNKPTTTSKSVDNNIANNNVLSSNNNNKDDTNGPKWSAQPSETPAIRFDYPTGNEQAKDNVDWTKICRLPLLEGMCRGFFPRFGYDVKTGECQQFIYGGCGGNGNRFSTKEECIRTCGQTH